MGSLIYDIQSEFQFIQDEHTFDTWCWLKKNKYIKRRLKFNTAYSNTYTHAQHTHIQILKHYFRRHGVKDIKSKLSSSSWMKA